MEDREFSPDGLVSASKLKPTAATPAAPGEVLRDALERLVHDIRDLADNSHGVVGLHKNGDDAPWSELVEGGRYDHWLGLALEQADAALAQPAQQGAGKDGAV